MHKIKIVIMDSEDFIRIILLASTSIILYKTTKFLMEHQQYWSPYYSKSVMIILSNSVIIKYTISKYE